MGILPEATLDSKGRIVIPGKLRKEAGLVAGSTVKVTMLDDVVAIVKGASPEEFIKELEGILKRGSSVERSNPLRLKEIWREG